MIQIEPRKTAVITGAAGGFGTCFANRLAQQGLNLLLIDCRATELNELCELISNEHSVEVKPIVVDLSDQVAVADLAKKLSLVEGLEFLINNAGFGHLNGFVESDADRHLEMVALHVGTPTQLTRAILPSMIKQNHGNIINLSSLSAWLPSGGAPYAATKSYLLVLSQSLHEELRGTNVRVQALCPGFVDTGFHNTVGMQGFSRQSIPVRWWMKADEVVACSLKGLQQNRAIVIPGWRNRLFSIGLRSPLLQPLIGKFLRPGH